MNVVPNDINYSVSYGNSQGYYDCHSELENDDEIFLWKEWIYIKEKI